MKHIVQSPEWGQFKTSMGTTALTAGNVQFTKHIIPFLNKYYAYAPKVNPQDINFAELEKSLIKENCIAINFDIPNVEQNTESESQAKEIFTKNNCIKSPRDTFAKANVVLDLTKSEEELLNAMHKKHRYNIRLAEKHGVKVREGKTQQDFETFYQLLKETADRQKYFVHSKNYYQKIWEQLAPKNIAHILIAEHENTPLTVWMLFSYENVLYYPYGGSSENQKNLQHSLAVAWEAIKLGKRLGCHTFDMWGAAENPNDKSDPWYGFTDFKLKFGGKYIKYMDSYDFVVNKPLYYLFNLANKIRWLVLRLTK